MDGDVLGTVISTGRSVIMGKAFAMLDKSWGWQCTFLQLVRSIAHMTSLKPDEVQVQRIPGHPSRTFWPIPKSRAIGARRDPTSAPTPGTARICQHEDDVAIAQLEEHFVDQSHEPDQLAAALEELMSDLQAPEVDEGEDVRDTDDYVSSSDSDTSSDSDSHPEHVPQGSRPGSSTDVTQGALPGSSTGPTEGLEPLGRLESVVVSRQPGLIKFSHTGGWNITYYDTTKQFIAHCCNYEKHGKRCFLSRSSLASKRSGPSWAGQGRPLGLLMAWLIAGTSTTCKDEDQAGHKKHKPAYPQRSLARVALEAMDGSEALFEMERQIEEGSDETPEPKEIA